MTADIVYESEITEIHKKGSSYQVQLRDQRFHPDGEGGQLGDRGTIGGQNVLQVLPSDSEEERTLTESSIYETASLVIQDPLQTRTPIICAIDGTRRTDIAQQHSAQHLMSAFLANHFRAQTIGFQMGEGSTTVDIDLAPWDWEKTVRLEEMCFEAILAQIPISVFLVEADEISQYNLRKPIPEKIAHFPRFRLVQIGDLDASLCSGFHTTNTGQIGLIKFIRVERIKGSCTRLTFLAGKRALRDYQRRVRLLNETTQKLSTSIDELDLRVNKLLDEHISTRRLNKHLSEELARQMYAKVSSHETKTGPHIVVELLPTGDIASEFSSHLVQMPALLAFLAYEMNDGYGFILISTLKDSNALEFYSRMQEEFSLKGGGNEKMVRGKAERIDLEEIRRVLKSG
jgi:alanyl-tRNA synthetase